MLFRDLSFPQEKSRKSLFKPHKNHIFPQPTNSTATSCGEQCHFCSYFCHGFCFSVELVAGGEHSRPPPRLAKKQKLLLGEQQLQKWKAYKWREGRGWGEMKWKAYKHSLNISWGKYVPPRRFARCQPERPPIAREILARRNSCMAFSWSGLRGEG